MKKPLIGITCNYDYRDSLGMASGVGTSGQDWNYVAGDYVYAVEKAGGVPVLIPQCSQFQVMNPLLEMLDGVLISGGHDVGPEHYGAFTKGYCGTVIPMRDQQDLELAQYCLQKKKPVLGICRGIQILNVATGGTLYQDLEKEGGYEHHFGDKYPRNVAWHTVSLLPDSRLAAIYGKEEIKVNSFHHQAVRASVEGSRVVGVSSDGVSEAIEIADHPFAIGVQWHPEMMYDSEEQLKLIRAFVDACC